MPNATVGAIIVNNLDNPAKVLLTQRNIPPFKGQWCYPGGHIDRYEDAVTAVIREVKEETGLDVEPHYLAYFDEIIPDQKVHNVVLMFYGECSGKINIQEEEVADIRWFAFEEAREMDLAFTHNEVLEYFMKKYNKI